MTKSPTTPISQVTRQESSRRLDLALQHIKALGEQHQMIPFEVALLFLLGAHSLHEHALNYFREQGIDVAAFDDGFVAAARSMLEPHRADTRKGGIH